MGRKKLIDIIGLAVVAGLVAVTAVVGSLFSVDGTSGWYRDLAKPSWNPPSWVFGPVWTCLYILIMVSEWLVWLRRGEQRIGPALAVFAVQLVLNALWSYLFFGLHRPDLALVDVCVLLVVIAINVGAFWGVTRWAGILLVPYMIWTGFATVLNFTLWRMNM